MFEQLDKPKKAPHISIAMSVGILAAYLVGALGGGCLFVLLGERPFGDQIATSITYTYFAFWCIFFPTRGLLERYSLRNKMVQQQFPLLLAIHSGFLIAIFLAQTALLLIKPRLPILVMGGFVIVVFFVQILISRGILSRGLHESLDESDLE